MHLCFNLCMYLFTYFCIYVFIYSFLCVVVVTAASCSAPWSATLTDGFLNTTSHTLKWPTGSRASIIPNYSLKIFLPNYCLQRLTSFRNFSVHGGTKVTWHWEQHVNHGGPIDFCATLYFKIIVRSLRLRAAERSETECHKLITKACSVSLKSQDSKWVKAGDHDLKAFDLVKVRQSAPLYRHRGSVQAARPTGGAEV
jgi:hypothetical protein